MMGWISETTLDAIRQGTYACRVDDNLQSNDLAAGSDLIPNLVQ